MQILSNTGWLMAEKTTLTTKGSCMTIHGKVTSKCVNSHEPHLISVSTLIKKRVQRQPQLNFTPGGNIFCRLW